MFNWNVDEKRFKKEDPENYKLWRLTQLINYGLDGEKLDRKEVIKNWPKIEENEEIISWYHLLAFLIWSNTLKKKQKDWEKKRFPNLPIN